jgi:hypothetical protein
MADVDWGQTKTMGLLGLLAGAVVATAVPLVVLTHGGANQLGDVWAALICALGVIGGIFLATISVFFSLAIPGKASNPDRDREQ